jgi:pimeloyl-ACP methyl ester carboxylesterase
MPYVQNNRVRIHYEVEGQGPPLVMVHGWNCSIGDFYEFGWVKELQDIYELILIDPRGHGYSDKPHEPAAYDRKLMVQDILAVMDALRVSQACYLGASLGGVLGFGLAKYAPQRLRALILGASDPYPSETTLEARRGSELWSKLTSGMKTYLEWTFPQNTEIVVTDWFLYRRLANDPAALLACLEAGVGVSYEELVPHNTIPCLLFVGTADTEFYPYVKQCAEEMPNTQLLEIPNREHGDLFRGTEPLLGIKRFLAKIHQ